MKVAERSEAKSAKQSLFLTFFKNHYFFESDFQVGASISDFESSFSSNFPQNSTIEELRSEYLVSLVTFVGIFQIAFALLRIDQLTVFMPTSVMSSFICGLALQVLIGQLKNIFGYSSEIMPTLFEPAGSAKIIIASFQNLPVLNVSSLL